MTWHIPTLACSKSQAGLTYVLYSCAVPTLSSTGLGHLGPSKAYGGGWDLCYLVQRPPRLRPQIPGKHRPLGDDAECTKKTIFGNI
ncbi:Coatomer Subunit Alpha [Manis pentadactyla]|nr:Coatomer Subunit Alpha [Manis pentadactyla]